MKKRGATLALILVISLIISGIPLTVFGLSNSKEQSNSNDPFEMMVDVNPDLMSVKEIIKNTCQEDVSQADIDTASQVAIDMVNIDIQPSEYEDIKVVKKIIEGTIEDIKDKGTNMEIDQALLEDVLRQQQDLVEQSKTDRFIVKYKGSGENSFKTKVGDIIQDSKEVDDSITEDYQTNVRRTSEDCTLNSPGNFLREAINEIAPFNSNKDKTQLITLEESVNPSEFADTLRDKGIEDDIEYIQPDFQMELQGLEDSLSKAPSEIITPDGISIKKQNTVEAITTDKGISKEAIPQEELLGKTQKEKGKVIVAIIDTGLDITHPELEKYIYVNQNEIPNNGIDDDGNGYIDDVNGWNFSNNSGVVYNEASGLEQAHGTHIAGIIAGASDINDAIVSNENITILPLKVFSNGTAYTSDIIASIKYAEKMGVKVVNCSFGSTDNNLALKDAIENSGMLFICSVGNARTDLDVTPIYPACFGLDNIISVTSTNADGGLSYFSNYSTTLVDVAAKGRDVNSTLPEGKHGLQSGTSMSAAMVSRIVAEILIMNSNLDTLQLKKRIINTSDRLSNLQEEVDGGRQINIANAINNVEKTSIVQNLPASDFDVIGYNPTQDELYKLYSSGNVAQVSAGDNSTFVLKKNGTVWSWGRNFSGQCGNGLPSHSVLLTQVIGLTDVISVSAGKNHTLAVKSDGTVWSWGDDYDVDSSKTPMQVSGLNGIARVAAGNGYSFAVKSDGTVWAWGSNYMGQLGDGTTSSRKTPVQISSLTGVASVVTGLFGHNLALKKDGTIWSWGNNDYGQLGDGTTVNKNTPVKLNSLTNVVSVDAGCSHNLAVKSDGTVWSWGANYSGQLGDGTMTNKTTPIQVKDLTGAVSVAAGACSLAVKSDGTVWAWGDNGNGQLGDGTTINRTTPIQVRGLTGVVNIAEGYEHSVVVRNDGTVWAWGDNGYGQLGDGTMGNSAKPVIVKNIIEGTGIAAGFAYSLAVKSDGTVWTWGHNNRGELGDGTTITKTTPNQVSGLSGVVSIVSGSFDGFAIKADKTVWAWGDNGNGQLADGTNYNKYKPIKINSLNNIISLAAGDEHSLMVKNDGTVWAWGNNRSGQLGDGTTISRTTPVKVNGLSNVVNVSAGKQYSAAVKSDGTVWAWGNNRSGQLGDGTSINRITPVQVSGLTDAVTVVAGKDFSVALKKDGTVWAWGINYNGQLGDGTSIDTTTPVKVSGLTDVIKITAGDSHSLALKSDGTVWAWGYNNYEQLGDGTSATRITPVKVIELTDVVSVAAGLNHSLALKSDGTVWAWGEDTCGQLGQSRILQYNVPIQCQTNVGLFSYESNSYTAAIPNSGSNKITVHASGTDSYGNTISAFDSVYSLAAPYTGVTINSATGEITIEPSAPLGPIQIIATYKNLTCSTMLNLTGDGVKKSTFSTSAGSTYNIPLKVCYISNFTGKSFTLNYDSSILQLVDLCAFTSAKETTAGVITGTGITIKSVSNGNIIMTIDKTIPDGKKWSGVINAIKFKAKATGETSVTTEYN